MFSNLQIKLVSIILFLSVSSLLSESFSGYFTRGLNYFYRNNLKELANLEEENYNWYHTLELYQNFWQSRLNHFSNQEEILSQLKSQIEFMPDDLTTEETSLLKGFLYGMSASIESETAFISPLRNGRRALDSFKQVETAFPEDAAFGIGAANLTAILFFDKSFIVKSLLGFKPSLLNGIKLLNKAALHGKISQVETLLFLNEYYAGIEENFRRALVYSEILIKQYPENQYFNYLHGKNLYNTNQFTASRSFLHRGSNISDKFYPFQYDALILESKSYYYSVLLQEAETVNNLAGSIMDGTKYYALKYQLMTIDKKTEAEIKNTIPAKYLTKLTHNKPADSEDYRKFLIKEIAVKQSNSYENVLSLLPSINSFGVDFRDKIILTMQEFVLNLDISETDCRRLLSRLAELLNNNEAKAESELLKIRLELYNRRFIKAAELLENLNRKYPFSIDQNDNNKRIKIWQRIIKGNF